MSEYVQEYDGKRVGEKVRPYVGNYKGTLVTILSIEINAGARRGWFKCETSSGIAVYYVGEELGK